ncbi:hypothetical protein [Leptospira ainazelensis]|uniref:hypothetical protein n=1 Tax=Leptospira ainazelensis TaxID=2810034 RepID=UPI001963773C|nr:hypothetical protein [Leptospira ainazelensis]
MKFLHAKANLKVWPNCNHWYGIVTKKRYLREKNHWLFHVACNSCGLKTAEFVILDQAKLNWNNSEFFKEEGS